MTIHDLYDWWECEKRLKGMNLTYRINGEYLDIYSSDKRFAGSFKFVGDLYMYLLGYEDGINAPRSRR